MPLRRNWNCSGSRNDRAEWPQLEWVAHRVSRAATMDELAETVNEATELMMVETHEWWVLLSFQGARLHV